MKEWAICLEVLVLSVFTGGCGSGSDEPGTTATAEDGIANSIGMKLVLIPAGEFTMGSSDGDDDERPPHKVRITQPFYLGKYEVTVGQFRKFVEKSKYDVGAGRRTDQFQSLCGRRLPALVAWLTSPRVLPP